MLQSKLPLSSMKQCGVFLCMEQVNRGAGFDVVHADGLMGERLHRLPYLRGVPSMLTIRKNCDEMVRRGDATQHAQGVGEQNVGFLRRDVRIKKQGGKAADK